MGHAIKFLHVEKREEIMDAANEFAFYNVDRGENPSGSYFGSLHIHDDVICDSWDDAVKWIDDHDKGFYDDHAVRYRKNISPTVTMRKKKEMINRIRASYSDFLESAKLKNRKSEYVTCPECGSKINIPALVKYRGEKMHSCPLCGTSLWSKSTMERNQSFNQRIEKAEREYEELEKNNNKKSSADLGWCVKDEVHC